MRKNINLILSKFQLSSMFSLERKRKKHWHKLPARIRFTLLKRQIVKLFGPNVKKSDEEIRKAQEEFFNYEYKN
jgi:hypothetical protein